MKPSRIRIAGFILSIGVFISTASAQVVWQRHAENPVVPAWSGDIDDPSSYKFCLEPSVMMDPRTKIHRMWYVSLAYGYGASGNVSLAMSEDRANWFKYSKNPVLRKGGPGAFDQDFIFSAYVVHNGLRYLMYYSGHNRNNGRINIGLAVSEDGVRWTKHASNPVLSVGPANSWDRMWAAYPRVLFDGAQYIMLYSGYDGTYSRTGLATSADGITWTKFGGNPVLNLGLPGSWDAACAGIGGIVKVDSIFYMLYTGNASVGAQTRIGLATSRDCVTWTRYASNPLIFPGSPGQWDESLLGGGSVLFRDGVFHFWFSGSSDMRNQWQIGYATSELISLSVPPIGELPKEFRVEQNFPNPFNPATAIRVHVPQRAELKLTIFDVLGREVRTLVTQTFDAGSHTFEWNGADNSGRPVASGVYTCSAELATSKGMIRAAAEKMVLLK